MNKKELCTITAIYLTEKELSSKEEQLQSEYDSTIKYTDMADLRKSEYAIYFNGLTIEKGYCLLMCKDCKKVDFTPRDRMEEITEVIIDYFTRQKVDKLMDEIGYIQYLSADITLDGLRSYSREQPFTLIRHICTYFIWHEMDNGLHRYSLTEISNYFNRKCHATALHAVRKIRIYCESYERFNIFMNEIKKKL